MFTTAQMKAARALLGWTQEDLAHKSRLSPITINRIERGLQEPQPETLTALSKAFTKGGVEFVDGGVIPAR